jgi:choline kinase
MKALILAAGVGSRLAGLTSGKPKCLLELHGKSMLRHQLDLLAACDVSDITIITGFGVELIHAEAQDSASFVHYPNFASTNNLLTLHYYRHLLEGDVMVLFADVLLRQQALQELIRRPADFALLVDSSRCLAGTMRVRLSSSAVIEIGPHIPTAQGDGNFIGVARFSARGSELLAAELDQIITTRDCSKAYYTEALASLAAKGHRLDGVNVDANSWLEVDTGKDYLNAQRQSFYLLNSVAHGVS